jgi:CTP:molybdopterin cytidylyltransferase MocA
VLTLARGVGAARHIIGEHAYLVCEVEMDDDAVLIDVDSPEALAAVTGKPADQASSS